MLIGESIALSYLQANFAENSAKNPGFSIKLSLIKALITPDDQSFVLGTTVSNQPLLQCVTNTYVSALKFDGL